MNCEYCQIIQCPLLNKDECPINKLWARTEEIQQEIAKLRLVQEAEALMGVEK